MESTKKTAHIQYTGFQIIISSPYDANFVSELKSRTKSRRWNPEKNGWIVDIKERQKLIEIANRFYQVVEDNQPTGLNVEPIKAPSGIHLASVLKPGTELENGRSSR